MKNRLNNLRSNKGMSIKRSQKLGILLAVGLIIMLSISFSDFQTSANAGSSLIGVEGDFSQNALPIPIVPPEGQGQNNVLGSASSTSLGPSISLNHMEAGPEKGPWRSLAVTPDSNYMAIGTTYRSNAFIHQVTVYQWNDTSKQFESFTNITEEQFRGDALDVEFADVDGDEEWELYVASSDGYIYSFELNSSSTVNPFNLVWKSTFLVKAQSIAIGDLNGDSRMEIVAGGWRNRVYVLGFGEQSTDWDNLHILWNSENLRDQILEVAIGDFNGDAKLDIALALRHGKLLIFEQVLDKTLCSPSSGIPDSDHEDDDDEDDDDKKGNDKNKKPSKSEECYNMTFSTTDYLWNKIIELEPFDLDLDNDDELGIVVKSQDVFILDYSENGFFLDRVTTSPQRWEQSGAYPIDYFPDKVLYANNTFFDGTVPEPMDWLDPQNLVSPYTSGMEANTLNHYTRFSGLNSWSLLDWGNYEEIVGGGNQGTDIIISLQNPYNGPLNNLSIILTNEHEDDDDDDHELAEWLSGLQELATNTHTDNHHDEDDDHEDEGNGKSNDHDHDHDHFEHEDHGEYAIVETINMAKSPDNLSILIDIDPAMIHSKMLSARYMYMWFNSSQGNYLDIQSIETTRINTRLDTVRSIGFDTAVLNLDSPISENMGTPILVAATAGGNLLTFASTLSDDPNIPLLKLVRNAYQEQRFTTGIDGAWDIKPIPTSSIVPNWINPRDQVELSNALSNSITQFFVGRDLNPVAPMSPFEGDLFIVMEGPQILWVPDPSSLSSSSITSDSKAVFGQVNAYYASLGAERISIALADLETTPNSPVPFGAYPELIVSYGKNNLDIWSLNSSFAFQFLRTISFTEITSSNRTLQDEFSPSDGMVFQLTSGDFDADGNEDIALTNGTNIYLVTRENFGNNVSYYFDSEFFASIEKAISSYGYHFFRRIIENIAAFDANGDNVADLMVSLFPRPGFTFFENLPNQLSGSRKFVEKRSLVHYRPLRTTFTNYDYEFALIWGTNQTFPLVNSMFISIDKTNGVSSWEASQLYQRSWIVATTSQVIQLTVNLADSSKGYNWGLQYFEQWSDDLLLKHRGHHHEDKEHDDEEHDEYDYHDDDHEVSDHYPYDHHDHKEYEHLNELILEPSIVIKSGDTDGDGLIDGIEGFSRLNALKTNIADPDTDGDGLSDTLELCLGLDPRSDDSDGDLIPDGLDVHDWWEDYEERCLASPDDDHDDQEDDSSEDIDDSNDHDDNDEEGIDNEDTDDSEEDLVEHNNAIADATETTLSQEQEFYSNADTNLEETRASYEYDENEESVTYTEPLILNESTEAKHDVVSVSLATVEAVETTFDMNADARTSSIKTTYNPIDRISVTKEQALMDSVSLHSLRALFPEEILVVFGVGRP